MPDLSEFIAKSRKRQWQPNVMDCCAWPAEWVMLNGHPDPMTRWRGAYATEAEAEALIAEAGALEGLWRIGMGDVGLPEVDTPEKGDIGLIRVIGVHGLETVIGGICTGQRWVFLTYNGIGQCRAEHITVWRP